MVVPHGYRTCLAERHQITNKTHSGIFITVSFYLALDMYHRVSVNAYLKLYRLYVEKLVMSIFVQLNFKKIFTKIFVQTPSHRQSCNFCKRNLHILPCICLNRLYNIVEKDIKILITKKLIINILPIERRKYYEQVTTLETTYILWDD